MAMVDIADLLSALLCAGGEESTTFQRMVRWYGEVADEMECRTDYDAMVRSLLAAWRAATSGMPVVSQV
ncbi:MAG: hypothetical protein NVSMB65_05800 [Chloroflexota bacterium]